MSLEKWRSAIEEIPDIIASEPTKDKAILLAALYALQGRFARQAIQSQVEAEPTAQGENEGLQDTLSEYMNEELADAEKYLKLWRKTGNADFKEIARQELSHFELLAKYARTIEPNIDLKSYMVHHNALMAKLA